MVIYSGLQRSLLKVLIVVSELQLFILITNGQPPASNAQPPEFVYYCPNSTTYNQNSTYHANLRRLLSDLSSNNAASKMFLNATAGNDSPDVIYGLVLCSGDLTIDECRQCLRIAATEIVQRCLVEKESYIWYDKCTLRYNNISFFGSLATSPNFHFWEMNKVLNQDRFNQVLEDAMDEVIIRAAGIGNVGPLKGFATGEANFNGLLKLYNLVQCTPDLSGSDCNFCLRYALSQRPDGSQSGRFMCPSCRIRYELYQFYSNDTTVASPDQPPDDIVAGGSGGPKTAVIIVIVVLISFSIIMSTMCFYFLRKKAREKKNIMMEDTEADSLQYDIRFIKDATNNFSADNKIGEGGFGEVFKGSLDNGQQIAVKRLSKSTGEGDQEFKNEVTIVAKLQHINLVLLLGYCLDTEEKILIFEFVPNKSLDFMLFDQGKETPLDWSSRYKIIGGVARGILYLHEDSRLRIIHRDIKASNVLLDNDLNAKISDFGLARIVGLDKSEGNTKRVVGTFGYMSPEYIMQGQFSVKSDVFSFGVLVLEIISGQRNNKFYRISDHLLSHAWNLWKDGKPLDLLDPTLGDSFDKYEVTRCTHIGLLCVQKDVDERPTMASVILMLNSSSMTLPMPHQPAFFMKDDIIPVSDLVESDLPSSNGVTVSEMYPR